MWDIVTKTGLPRESYWIACARLNSEKPKPKGMLKNQANPWENWLLSWWSGHFFITTHSPVIPNKLQVTMCHTLFHKSVPLTAGHAILRSLPPIFSFVNFHDSSMTHLKQFPRGNSLHFLSVSKAHTVYTHITTNIPLLIETGIVLVEAGTMASTSSHP